MYTQVDVNVTRGPRPEAADFLWIRNTFKTVISLEGAAEDAQEAIDLAPVPVISQSISLWEIYIAGISENKLAEILTAINIAPKPVLVHCQHGQDRTGLVIAAYRVTSQAWTKDAAMAEALKFGYRKWLNKGLNSTWKDFGVS